MADVYWKASDIPERARKGEAGRDPNNKIAYTFLHHGGHCTLNAVSLEDRMGIPSHIHREHDEIIQILEGEGEIVVGEESLMVKKGDVFFVEKAVPHAIKFPCVILSVYSPAFDPKNPDREFVK